MKMNKLKITFKLTQSKKMDKLQRSKLTQSKENGQIEGNVQQPKENGKIEDNIQIDIVKRKWIN